MPFFEYACDNGHTIELRRAIAARHDPVVCESCGEPAALIPSLTGGFVGIRNRVEPTPAKVSDTARTFQYVDGLCDRCANKTTVFLDDDGKPEPTECEHCGGTSFTYSMPKPVPSSVTYPYYNRGLGCIVNSPGHLCQLMRQQGVVEADPLDLLYAAERHASKVADAAAKQKADIDKMNAVPEHKQILDSEWYKDLQESAIREAIGDNPNVKVTVNPAGVSP